MLYVPAEPQQMCPSGISRTVNQRAGGVVGHAYVAPAHRGVQPLLGGELADVKIGDVLVEQGNLPAALDAFKASHAIFDRLAKADPGNAGWQRNLALSFERVAMVEAQQGARDRATGLFRQGRDIIAGLKARSPDNATLARDLAWFEGQIAALSK
jgi:hypothetical protein